MAEEIEQHSAGAGGRPCGASPRLGGNRHAAGQFRTAASWLKRPCVNARAGGRRALRAAYETGGALTDFAAKPEKGAKNATQKS